MILCWLHWNVCYHWNECLLLTMVGGLVVWLVVAAGPAPTHPAGGWSWQACCWLALPTPLNHPGSHTASPLPPNTPLLLAAAQTPRSHWFSYPCQPMTTVLSAPAGLWPDMSSFKFHPEVTEPTSLYKVRTAGAVSKHHLSWLTRPRPTTRISAYILIQSYNLF